MVSRAAFDRMKTKGLLLRVYCGLLLRGNPGDDVCISSGELSGLIGSSRRWVIKSLQELSEMGLIFVTGDRGERGKVTYHLCRTDTSESDWCRTDTPSERKSLVCVVTGVEPTLVVGPTIDIKNNKEHSRQQSRKWGPPKWVPSDLLTVVQFHLGAASSQPSQAQDRYVWQYLRHVEKEGDEARCNRIREAAFWGEIIKASDWPPPPKGVGRAGYGKRIVIEIKKRLESVQGEDKLRAAAVAHRKNIKESFGK